MTAKQFLTADLLDILFENRNKAYGAYMLRKEYPSNLKRAIGVMLLLVCCFAIIAFAVKRSGRNHVVPGEEMKEVKIVEVKMRDEQKPVEQKPVTPRPPTKLDRVPVLVNNPDTTKLVPVRTDPTDYVNGPANDPGTGGDPNATVLNPASAAGTDITGNTPTKPEPEEPAFVENPDEDPEFPGGINAWLKYLKNVTYAR